MLQIAHLILEAADGAVVVDVANRGATFRDEQDRSVTIRQESFQDGFNWYWNQRCLCCWQGAFRRITILNRQAVILQCTHCQRQFRYKSAENGRPARRRRG